MNIFIIPSWYPNDKVPLGGSFTKEQSMAFAELSPNYNVIVSKWDDGYTHLTPREPFQALKNIYFYKNKKIIDEKITNNFYEYYTPVITWSKKLPFGGSRNIYSSIRDTFLRAKEKIGKIDIIHAHVSYPAGYIAFLLSKEFGIPYIITEHMSPFPFASLLKNNKPIKEIEIAFKNATRTIAVSSSLQSRIKSFDLPCSDVVSNLVDEKLFFPSTKKNNKFTFFTLCGISNQKGIDTLIEAISNLDKELQEKIDFKIGGDGVELERYKRLTNELGLENIHWIGSVARDDAPELFSTSHAYIMLSRHETFGIVYAEAIASGIPVIATRCGGPEDIVNDINGLLVEIDNVTDAVEAIKYLYQNYSKYNSSAIRDDFENRFGKVKFVEKIKTIYKESI